MPLGSHHEIEGLLLRRGRLHSLHPDGGGTWRLDAPRAADRLAGQRVRVRGVRSGFDLLDVTAIAAAGADFPLPWWSRLLAEFQRHRRSPP